MKLHEALLQSVDQFGKQVIGEHRLINIVNDFNAYKEFPALKKVFPEVIKDGYATQIYEDSQKKASTAVANARNFAKSFEKEKNYNNDLVNYCFDSLLYSLGLITSITEPITKGFDPTAKNTNILDGLDEKLTDLKKKYFNLLDKSIIAPKDVLYEPPAYIPTDAMSSLIEVEYKIIAISQQLGTLPLDWCKKERESRLKTLNEKRDKLLLSLFADLRSKYEKTIKENIVISHFMWVKRSGYISKKGVEELTIIEKDIRLAYSALNRAYDNWCEKEKYAHLNAYKITRQKFIFDVILKILLPLYLLSVIIANIFVAVYADLPAKSMPENIEDHVEQVESTEQVGEEQVEEKVEQKVAVEIEHKIEINVEPKTEKKVEKKKEQKKEVLKSEDKVEQKKQETVEKKVEPVVEQKTENNVEKKTEKKFEVKNEVKNEDQSAKLEDLYNRCTMLVNKGNIAEAAILFGKETKGKTYDYSYGNWRYYDTKALITKALDQWVETLIKQISRNESHLPPKVKKKVKEVVQIFPNNYWINVINKWENEKSGTYGSSARSIYSRGLTNSTSISEPGELVYLLNRVGFAPNPDKIERENGAIIMTTDIKTALKLFQACNDLIPDGETTKNTVKLLKSKAKQ